MPLPAGARLGPYEIVAPLGAGGMGVVYKARDSRLDRLVALKTIGGDAARTAEAIQRFEREARAISSLSHPHICALFDVGTADGVEYLVMELLEGQTLASRIASGPLPIDTVLQTGVEIAQALAAAHARGIVHRDLKPGNVMITPSGVKLLDFGLGQDHRGPDAGRGRRGVNRGRAGGAHRARHDRRHGGLHGAGTDPGRGRGRAQRRVRAWRGAVRDGDRPPRVCRQHRGRGRRGDPAPGPAIDRIFASGRAAGPRSARARVPRQGSRRAVANGARCRARAHRHHGRSPAAGDDSADPERALVVAALGRGGSVRSHGGRRVAPPRPRRGAARRRRSTFNSSGRPARRTFSGSRA